MPTARRLLLVPVVAACLAAPVAADARVTPGDSHVASTARPGTTTTDPQEEPAATPAEDGPRASDRPGGQRGDGRDDRSDAPGSDDPEAPAEDPSAPAPAWTPPPTADQDPAPGFDEVAGADEVAADASRDGEARPAGVTTPTPPVPDLRCDAPRAAVERHPGRSWRRVVVDPVRRLPEDWRPDDLESVGDLGFDDDAAPQVRGLVLRGLEAMAAAARDDGARFVVVSGFRSQSYQQGLWEREVADRGSERAAAGGMARAGHSEHQLGTTVDVVDPSLPHLDRAMVDTPAGRWLAEHATEYGFVASYPRGERDVTCFKAEPWHLRYVGRPLAAEVADAGVSLREFLLAG